jgi:hypothetical protein
MATYYISPESCRGRDSSGYAGMNWRPGLNIPCLALPPDRPRRPNPRLGNTEQQRWWRTHPTEAQAIADAAEVPIESLLCKGCQKMYARLVRAGEWP